MINDTDSSMESDSLFSSSNELILKAGLLPSIPLMWKQF